MDPVDTSSHGELRWRDVEGKEVCTGKVALVDRASIAYVMLDFQCYFLPIGNGHAVLWYEESLENVDAGRNDAAVRVRLIDLEALRPLGKPAELCAEMKDAGQRAALNCPKETSFEIPSSLPTGTNQVVWPEAFRTIDEVLMLVHAPPKSTLPAWEAMDLRLWIVQPRAHVIEVYPQDWFNSGGYDYGYQWVTRVARDPRTQRVMGEGIRIRSFVLDASLRNIEKWL